MKHNIKKNKKNIWIKCIVTVAIITFASALVYISFEYDLLKNIAPIGSDVNTKISEQILDTPDTTIYNTPLKFPSKANTEDKQYIAASILDMLPMGMVESTYDVLYSNITGIEDVVEFKSNGLLLDKNSIQINEWHYEDNYLYLSDIKYDIFNRENIFIMRNKDDFAVLLPEGNFENFNTFTADDKYRSLASGKIIQFSNSTFRIFENIYSGFKAIEVEINCSIPQSETKIEFDLGIIKAMDTELLKSTYFIYIRYLDFLYVTPASDPLDAIGEILMPIN